MYKKLRKLITVDTQSTFYAEHQKTRLIKHEVFQINCVCQMEYSIEHVFLHSIFV